MKLYTTKAVAECLGITDRQVRNLRDDGILSEAKPGLFTSRQSCGSISTSNWEAEMTRRT